MTAADPNRAISRRSLLIGGGAGVGLVLAWAVWPRHYPPNLTAAPGETILGAWLKIGEDGHVTVAVPQAECGQGVTTALPQILADELGADWRTVAVEAAPINPLYANGVAAEELFGGAMRAAPAWLREQWIERSALMLTAGSSSVRRFAQDLQDAGAAARVLLCKAAAARWSVDWQDCATRAGFVVQGDRRLRFGALAAAAARYDAPDPLPYRGEGEPRLVGRSLPRLDVPAKIDGSANFAADVRLPGMRFAAIRQRPPGARRLTVDHAAAERVPGVSAVVETDDWIATVASDGWAAERALDAMAPRFAVHGTPASTGSVDRALEAALARPGHRLAEAGDVAAALHGGEAVAATYRAGPAVHAAIEPMTATANWSGGRLELWLPTQAPALARAAGARAIDVDPAQVTVHPMLVGGGFGAGLEHRAAEQAAVLTQRLGHPIQLTWSRGEDLRQDPVRPPALARMTARLSPQGRVLAWSAAIAVPSTGDELARRLLAGDDAAAALMALPGQGDGYAVEGAAPNYAVPAWAVDHHPAAIGLPTGHLRGGAHGYTAFFSEAFVDELAHHAGAEPLSFRIAMLGGEPRLARCLSTVASLGGWQGGGAGSGQGIACHSVRGSHIAVLAEAHVEDGRIRVDRLVAGVDCGRQIHPDLIRQQVEGGLIFGMATALGAPVEIADGVVAMHRLRDLMLPTLADTPDINIELIASEADPGGVSELAVPPVAPAIATALFSATGVRLRSLPFRLDQP